MPFSDEGGQTNTKIQFQLIISSVDRLVSHISFCPFFAFHHEAINLRQVEGRRINLNLMRKFIWQGDAKESEK